FDPIALGRARTAAGMATRDDRATGAQEYSDPDLHRSGGSGAQQTPLTSSEPSKGELMKMACHRFKVGQLVDFSPARPGVPTSGRKSQIVQAPPAEGGELLYRVKSKSEAFQRVAKESELTRRN